MQAFSGFLTNSTYRHTHQGQRATGKVSASYSAAALDTAVQKDRPREAILSQGRR